jgi:hypothetical protein
MPEVIYQTREDLYPRFGLALPDKQQVYVREDIPGGVKRFVISHELIPPERESPVVDMEGGLGDYPCCNEASDRIHCLRVDESGAISHLVLFAEDSWHSEVRD